MPSGFGDAVPGIDDYGFGSAIAEDFDLGALLEIRQKQREKLLHISRDGSFNTANHVVFRKPEIYPSLRVSTFRTRKKPEGSRATEIPVCLRRAIAVRRFRGRGMIARGPASASIRPAPTCSTRTSAKRPGCCRRTGASGPKDNRIEHPDYFALLPSVRNEKRPEPNRYSRNPPAFAAPAGWPGCQTGARVFCIMGYARQ